MFENTNSYARGIEYSHKHFMEKFCAIAETSKKLMDMTDSMNLAPSDVDGTKDYIAEQIMKIIEDVSEAELIFDEINTIVID